MASAIFKPSRIISVLILLGAAGWIASGVFSPSAHEGEPEAPPGAETPVVPVQKVTVAAATPGRAPAPHHPLLHHRGRPQLRRRGARERHHHRAQCRARRPGDRRPDHRDPLRRGPPVGGAAGAGAPRPADRRVRSQQGADRQGPGAEEPADRARGRGRRGARRACGGARPRPTGRSSARRSPA